MNATRSAEHRELGQVMRKFFDSAHTIEQARAELDHPTDGCGLWKRQVAELELSGLGLPESVGGQGFGVPELAVVAEESGRALAGGPFFSTACLAAPVLQRAAKDDALVTAIATGATVALAIREPGGTWDAIKARVEVTDGVTRLSARKVDVLDAAASDHLVVAARDSDGIVALWSVDDSQAGVDVVAVGALDASRVLHDVVLDGAAVTRISIDADVAQGLSDGLDVARVCLASEEIAAGARCLERILENLTTRHQFGRPIGAFQELQHRAVDVMVALELATHGVRHAVLAVDDGAEDAPLLVSMAAAAASDAFRAAAAEEVQFLGGMGVAWESDAHLYLRRAVQASSLLGTSTWHRARLARLATQEVPA